MGLFSKKKTNGDSRVGPILQSLYDDVSPSDRPAVKKLLSGAPSGCELVAMYKNAPSDTAEIILSALTGLPGPGVVAAYVLSDGVAVYVKGEFPKDAFATMAQAFRQSGDALGLEVDVLSERFGEQDLHELP